ncbi:MAG: hypothetical protein IKY53_06505 [Lachnospiraceae bacterium]|nr:hypothetical protein [Lachnospiraceae bacterium]
MSEVFLRMKEMGVLLVIGSLLQYLLPSQEYARYVRLLTITILITYFSAPVLRLFSPGGFEQFCLSCEAYYAQVLSGTNSATIKETMEEQVDQKWEEWGVMYLQENNKTEDAHESDK